MRRSRRVRIPLSEIGELVLQAERGGIFALRIPLILRRQHKGTLWGAFFRASGETGKNPRAVRREGSHTPLGDLKVYFQGGECGYLRQRRNYRACEAVARCVPPTPKAVGYPYISLSRRRVRVSSPKVYILLVFSSSSCSGKVIPSVVRTLGMFVYSARSSSIDK